MSMLRSGLRTAVPFLTRRSAVLRRAQPCRACLSTDAGAQKAKATPEERKARRLTPLPKNDRYTGTVVSSRMQKTVMVEVTRLVKNEKYQKIVAKRRKFAVHDEDDVCRVGDLVEFAETRKFSKTKAHIVTDILKKEDYVSACSAMVAHNSPRCFGSQRCTVIVLLLQINRDEPRRRRTEPRDFEEGDDPHALHATQ